MRLVDVDDAVAVVLDPCQLPFHPTERGLELLLRHVLQSLLVAYHLLLDAGLGVHLPQYVGIHVRAWKRPIERLAAVYQR